MTEVVLAERKRCLRRPRYTAALMATLRTKWFVVQPNKCKSNETEVTSCLFTLPRCHHMNRAEKRGSVFSTLVNDLDFNIIASVPCIASHHLNIFGMLFASRHLDYRISWAQVMRGSIVSECRVQNLKQMMSYNYPQITAHMNGQSQRWKRGY